SVWCARCVAGSLACANRPMSWIFPAATARSRSPPAPFPREGSHVGGLSRTQPASSTPTLPIRRVEETRVAEPNDPVMIIVGGGAIALDTAQELSALQGHRVVVLWRRDADFARWRISAPSTSPRRARTAP